MLNVSENMIQGAKEQPFHERRHCAGDVRDSPVLPDRKMCMLVSSPFRESGWWKIHRYLMLPLRERAKCSFNQSWAGILMLVEHLCLLLFLCDRMANTAFYKSPLTAELCDRSLFFKTSGWLLTLVRSNCLRNFVFFFFPHMLTRSVTSALAAGQTLANHTPSVWAFACAYATVWVE